MTKQRSPTDLTLRNLRALKKMIAALAARVTKLEARVRRSR